MYAFDRDGTVIGSLTSYEANHPKHIKSPDDMALIKPVIDWINVHGAIIISNQDGPSEYMGSDRVRQCFERLMSEIPGLQACFWSERNFEGKDGRVCRILERRDPSSLSISELKFGYRYNSKGIYRKPQIGMALQAKAMGYPIAHYVGDLSGNPDWGNGKDSDRVFAENAGLEYQDVKDFI